MLALWPKDFHAAPVELRCLSFERPVHHCRGLVLTGDAALFLPKWLLYLIENIRARQTHVSRSRSLRRSSSYRDLTRRHHTVNNSCNSFQNRRRRKAVTLIAGVDITARSTVGGLNFWLHLAKSGCRGL